MGDNSRDKDILSWVELSDYDIKTAKAMQKAGRYLYVLFCCQQAIEKRLKAIIVKETKEFPPKLHDLIRLLELTKISLNNEQELFLRKLSNFYIETRYPEEMHEINKKVNAKLAAKYLKDAEELIKCLNQQLK